MKIKIKNIRNGFTTTTIGAIVALIAAVVLGGGYLIYKVSINQPITDNKTVAEADGMTVWKIYNKEPAIEYPADWAVQEELSYGVDGAVNYRGVSLVPPTSKAPLQADKIFIGEHRVSICSDVPQATKCAGGGKGSSFTVTFTDSTNLYVLDMFDKIIQRWEKR